MPRDYLHCALLSQAIIMRGDELQDEIDEEDNGVEKREDEKLLGHAAELRAASIFGTICIQQSKQPAQRIS